MCKNTYYIYITHIHSNYKLCTFSLFVTLSLFWSFTKMGETNRKDLLVNSCTVLGCSFHVEEPCWACSFLLRLSQSNSHHSHSKDLWGCGREHCNPETPSLSICSMGTCNVQSNPTSVGEQLLKTAFTYSTPQVASGCFSDFESGLLNTDWVLRVVINMGEWK